MKLRITYIHTYQSSAHRKDFLSFSLLDSKTPRNTDQYRDTLKRDIKRKRPIETETKKERTKEKQGTDRKDAIVSESRSCVQYAMTIVSLTAPINGIMIRGYMPELAHSFPATEMYRWKKAESFTCIFSSFYLDFFMYICMYMSSQVVWSYLYRTPRCLLNPRDGCPSQEPW